MIIAEEHLISVVMTVKNCGPYLIPCLDSIIDQDYTNWELFIVDDHSTDNTAQIIQNYESVDTRIRKINQKGSGIINGLRASYEASSGSLITRMDGDDIMAEDKLEELSKVLIDQGMGYVSIGLVDYFSDQVLGQGYHKYASWLNQLTRRGTNFLEIYKECTIPSPCWMMHRDDFEKCGGFQSDIYPEDYDLAFWMRAEGIKVIGVPSTLHRWRDYPERTSRHDPHYSDNAFLELKLYHYLRSDYSDAASIVIWGAGKKGKRLAALMKSKDLAFYWLTENDNKIGREIYDVKLENLDVLSSHENLQVIILLSSPKDQHRIDQVKKSCPDHQYFHWC